MLADVVVTQMLLPGAAAWAAWAAWDDAWEDAAAERSYQSDLFRRCFG